MISVTHKLHFPWFEFDTGKDLRILYLLQMARVFVDKLALFFLPIYLFELGGTWIEQGNTFNFFAHLEPIQMGMITVALFYAVFRLAALVALPFVNLSMYYYGNRLTTTLSYAFFGLCIVFLHSSTQYSFFVWIAAVALGFFISFNHVSEFTILATNAHKANIGKDIGLGRFLMQLANMVAPFLSAMIIVYAGYGSVFLIGVLLVVGVLALSQWLSGRTSSKLATREVAVQLSTNRPFQQMMVSTFGRYINDCIIGLWPIYLFVLLGSIDRVGFLYSASFFLAMIVAMVGGAQIDKSNKLAPYFGSGFALAGLWIVRIFALNPFTIAFIDALDRVFSNYHWIYFETTLLKAVKIRQPSTYLIIRAFWMSVFAIIFWLCIAVMFYFVLEGWRGLFILGAVGMMFSLFIRDNMRYDQP